MPDCLNCQALTKQLVYKGFLVEDGSFVLHDGSSADQLIVPHDPTLILDQAKLAIERTARAQEAQSPEVPPG